MFFFFNQKTAYEMRISDWSSDVCSSDLLVLVGDPMQLPQPLQGTHPGRSGDSCLEYLIDGHRVVPADRGIFMPVSRRMHPAVCNYISVAVYEGKLHSDDAAGSQSLVAKDGRSEERRVGKKGVSTCKSWG